MASAVGVYLLVKSDTHTRSSIYSQTTVTVKIPQADQQVIQLLISNELLF